MKLKEYIESLQELAKATPEALEMEVIYAMDPEGNGYDKVYFEPSIGVYDEGERDYMSLESEDYEYEKSETRVICIN
jgi:hypothetical protein